MNTKTFNENIPNFLNKLENMGYSHYTIDSIRGIINSFSKYCKTNNVTVIESEVIKKFYLEKYNINIISNNVKKLSPYIRPLLIFFDYINTGNFLKNYKKRIIYKPLKFEQLFLCYESYVQEQKLSQGHARAKYRVITFFLEYLGNYINDIKNLKIEHCYNFIQLRSLKIKDITLSNEKMILREFLDFLYQKRLIDLNGHIVFPVIKANRKNKMISSYTKEELEKILNVIDITTKVGKFQKLVLVLLIYYGLRASDIVNLKFNDINWETSKISIIQLKTKQPLTLPLIDEVKFPLLDYIKNARNESVDKNYILATLLAPYQKYKASALEQHITPLMNKAGIDYSNKHHGPHSFRHSLATNMINTNVPIEQIKEILGHECIKSTAIYITKDSTHLRELTLEVPNE
mgnify:FL=1